MTPPIFSVIIPVYNVERYLSRCLESVVNQSLRDIEIIVVNDGSTDGSLDIIDRYASSDTRIQVISQSNGGLSAARNSGLDVAVGEFIALVDSDDYIDLDMLEKMLAVAIRDDVDIVQCGVARVDGEGRILEQTQMVPPFTFEAILLGNVNRAAWNKIYRRRLFTDHQIRYPVGLLHEDLCVTPQLYYFARHISWIDSHPYYWLKREDSISQSLDERHLRDHFRNFQMLADFLVSEGVMANYEDAFVRGCFHYAASLSDRINHTLRGNPKRFMEMHALLQQLMNSFSYTSSARFAWLKSHDRNLFIKLYGGNPMADNLHELPKDQLVTELKRARLELHMRETGYEGYQSFVNLDFNTRMNRLFEWLKRYQQQYPRIAVYGNSIAGRMVAKELGKSLVVVADQGARNIRGVEYKVCVPEDLPEYEFDCLLVCVLGREESITRYLTSVVGIDARKILTFDLVNELPPYDRFAADYQNLIARIAAGEPIIGYHPLNVQIQTVSACNANCYFCPYVGSWHQQNPGRMDDDMFFTIVDKLANYKIKKFCPYLENEPFLDKKLFDKVQYAIEKLKPEVVEISTNLSILMDRHIEGLINVLAKIPHELRISFHGIDKDTYENVMELNYETSLANVKKVVGMMQELPLNVMIRGTGEPRQSANLARRWFGEVDYRKFWAEQLAEFKKKPRLDFFTYHDRAGQSQLTSKGMDFNAHRETLKDFYCTRFDRWVHFLYTGEPILCCMDYNKETAFGKSVKDMSVEELFTSDVFVNMIKQGTGMCESKPDHICKRCISPGG